MADPVGGPGPPAQLPPPTVTTPPGVIPPVPPGPFVVPAGPPAAPPIVPAPTPIALPKSREFTVTAPTGYLKTVYGEGKMGADVVYVKSVGQYLYVKYIIGDGAWYAVNTLKFDDVDTGAWGDVTYDVHLGDTIANGGHAATIITSAVDGIGSNMPSLCWVEARFGNPANRDSSSQGVGGNSGNLPRLTCIPKGNKIRNSRVDLTTYAYATNFANIAADFMTNPRYGGGFPDDAVDFNDTVKTAADRCDDNIAPSGPAVKRFQCGFLVISGGQTVFSVMEGLRGHFQCYIPYNGGMYQMVMDLPRSNCGLTFRDATLYDTDNVTVLQRSNIAPFPVLRKKGGRDVPNEINVKYTDCTVTSPATISEFRDLSVTATDPRIAYGTIPYLPVDYQLLGAFSHDQANRNAVYILNHATVADSELDMQVSLQGIEPLPGARVSVICDYLGLDGSVDWVVLDCEPDGGGIYWNLLLEPYSALIYSDVIQTVSPPLTGGGPGPNDAPTVPTALTVIEDVQNGTDNRLFSRIKISWTHNGSPRTGSTRVMVNNGLVTYFVGDVPVTSTSADGPAYFDNPRLGVVHTVTIYSVGTNGILSSAVTATITPVYSSDPVPNVTGLTTPHVTEADLGKMYWTAPTGAGADIVSYFDVYDNYGTPSIPPYLFTIAKDSNPSVTQPIYAPQAIHGSIELGRDLDIKVKTVNRLGNKSTGVRSFWHVDGTLLPRTAYFYTTALSQATVVAQSWSGARGGGAVGLISATRVFDNTTGLLAYDHRVTAPSQPSGEASTIVRTFMQFNTNDINVLPSDATIVGVDLEVYGTWPQTCVAHVIANGTVTADWYSAATEAEYLALFNAALASGSPVDFGGQDMSTYLGTGYRKITLNATGVAAVNLLGVTKFSVITENDLLNSAPTIDTTAHSLGASGWSSAPPFNAYSNRGTFPPGPRIAVRYTSLNQSLTDVGVVALQSLTPGAAQVGNAHIDGKLLVGSIDVEASITGDQLSVREIVTESPIASQYGGIGHSAADEAGILSALMGNTLIGAIIDQAIDTVTFYDPGTGAFEVSVLSLLTARGYPTTVVGAGVVQLGAPARTVALLVVPAGKVCEVHHVILRNWTKTGGGMLGTDFTIKLGIGLVPSDSGYELDAFAAEQTFPAASQGRSVIIRGGGPPVGFPILTAGQTLSATVVQTEPGAGQVTAVAWGVLY